ncbi:MAG: glycerol-3-phosphate 1-O-acyltransferase PlsY [Clostridia bacterium]|nr:glycerol-3-phosphate 1-O-acyltransferase PlsY [Clostridia bacterium]
MNYVYVVLTVILAYLLGSISFAVVFSKIFMKKDVRELGSGNAGTTNVIRTGGFKVGAITFLGDVLKGFVACFVGKLVFAACFENGEKWAVYGAFICGLACMLGHVFPIFFQFKGGKGIATSVGIFAVCCWPAILLGLAVFTLGVFITRIVSISSIIAAITVASCSMAFHKLINPTAQFWPIAVLSAVMGILVIAKHSDNIKRLINGTEKKMTFGRKK